MNNKSERCKYRNLGVVKGVVVFQLVIKIKSLNL